MINSCKSKVSYGVDNCKKRHHMLLDPIYEGMVTALLLMMKLRIMKLASTQLLDSMTKYLYYRNIVK